MSDSNQSSPGCVTHTDQDEYANITPLEWAEYEFATIEYDYRIQEEAAARIRGIFKQLVERVL